MDMLYKWVEALCQAVKRMIPILSGVFEVLKQVTGIKHHIFEGFSHVDGGAGRFSLLPSPLPIGDREGMQAQSGKRE